MTPGQESQGDTVLLSNFWKRKWPQCLFSNRNLICCKCKHAILSHEEAFSDFIPRIFVFAGNRWSERLRRKETLRMEPAYLNTMDISLYVQLTTLSNRLRLERKLLTSFHLDCTRCMVQNATRAFFDMVKLGKVFADYGRKDDCKFWKINLKSRNDRMYMTSGLFLAAVNNTL